MHGTATPPSSRGQRGDSLHLLPGMIINTNSSHERATPQSLPVRTENLTIVPDMEPLSGLGGLGARRPMPPGFHARPEPRHGGVPAMSSPSATVPAPRLVDKHHLLDRASLVDTASLHPPSQRRSVAPPRVGSAVGSHGPSGPSAADRNFSAQRSRGNGGTSGHVHD